jgi:hypothetical protein
MWDVYVADGWAQTSGETVIQSPIRYGDAAALPEGAEVSEAFPLEEGREYSLYLHRACGMGIGTSLNTAEGTFTYDGADGAE